MKKLILSICILYGSVCLFSENPAQVASGIKSVTVYLQGALVLREGTVTVPKGKTTLVLKGLSSKISPETIQVTASDGVTVLSVNHSMDYLNKATSGKEMAKLDRRRKDLLDSIRMIQNYKSVYVQERDMILSNKSLAGNNGVNVNELEQAAAFFRKRLTEIETALHKLDNSVQSLKEDIVAVSKQLMELNSKVDMPTSQISVVVSSEIETKSDLKINYFIPDASWIPAYDLRIKDVNEPLSLFYNARVIQNTEEDWDNVKLTLSTGNPSISNTKPELTAYYLTFNNYYHEKSGLQNIPGQPVKGRVSGKVTDQDSKDGMPGVNVVVKGTSTGAVTDADGNYQIDLPPGFNTLVFSFIGYNEQEVAATSPVINVMMTLSATALNEVVVTAYGIASDDGQALQGRASGLNVSKRKEQIPIAIEKRQLTTEFQIKTPYSIPSDNKPYDVSMVEYVIDAQYIYSTVPKLSRDAYLTARIPDFFKYNLLGGTASIFLKGIYQGESFLDPDTSADTLNVSVGRDRDISVSRDIQKDYVSRSISGNTRKEQKSWLITLKNNKDVPVSISVEDQYPIPKSDDIKVDLVEITGAGKDESTGKLTWDLTLKPKEKKELLLRYSVKYPSGRPLIID